MGAPGSTIDVTPSIGRLYGLLVSVGTEVKPGTAEAIGWLVGVDGPVPAEVDVDRAGLARCGFTGDVGQCLVLPGPNGTVQLVAGIGAEEAASATVLRDAAASLVRAVPQLGALAVHLPGGGAVPVADAAGAVVEGLILGRYHFHVRSADDTRELSELTLVAGSDAVADAEAGARRGRVIAEATSLGRDLANCPAGYLTATRIGQVAQEAAERAGLQVEVFDKAALVGLGCGGLLGVNAGSVEPPTMVKLTYRPDGGTRGHLGLVGKGIMYDSGGIALKPADASHSQMKNDMTGAGVILAAMTALRALSCPVTVTGWLMCTDNMPSGSATRLGDVLTMRGGKRVEVLNTDAEGRLVMADALVLAVEDGVDAIVDIATLTGQCLRTFGTEIAGVMGTDQALVDQVVAAGDAVDEPVWQLPLARRYRNQLDSPIADLTNMGGPNAGSITAALFLAEFVGGTPWAHVDIAGTAQSDVDRTWRTKGATGFGTPLLIELATRFAARER
ncbi:MAG TPA: leucyl aminopeptidase [Mycobacteriales bacterium]|nr:leucyl aminopeptidase [Mycobacteriales bacterium]